MTKRRPNDPVAPVISTTLPSKGSDAGMKLRVGIVLPSAIRLRLTTHTESPAWARSGLGQGAAESRRRKELQRAAELAQNSRP